MKTALAAAVVAVVIIVVVLLTRGHGDDAQPSSGSATTGAATSASTRAGASGSARVDVPAQVRKVSPEDRRRLAEQIAAARAKAKANTARGSEPALADDTITVEQVGPEVKRAMEAAIPILAECYRDRVADAGLRVATVQMVMTSDPDLGTVIDTAEMTDDAGQKLDPKLDDCLRSTIDSLELPPLQVGGRLPLQYSFKFD